MNDVVKMRAMSTIDCDLLLNILNSNTLDWRK